MREIPSVRGVERLSENSKVWMVDARSSFSSSTRLVRHLMPCTVSYN